MELMTMEQLRAQEKRRERTLRYLRITGAPEKAILQEEKDLKMTRIRIERLQIKEAQADA